MPTPSIESQIADWVKDLRADIEHSQKRVQTLTDPEDIAREISYIRQCQAQLDNPRASLREALKGCPAGSPLP